jgi:hypothetical protein
MYEFAMSNPDETLVRVGWPLRSARGRSATSPSTSLVTDTGSRSVSALRIVGAVEDTARTPKKPTKMSVRQVNGGVARAEITPLFFFDPPSIQRGV